MPACSLLQSSRSRLARLLGWLLGLRGGEQGRATAESLRMQLDEVVKERDSNRRQCRSLLRFVLLRSNVKRRLKTRSPS